MTDENADMSARSETRPKRRYATPLLALALIGVGIAAFANTLGNKALFHHVPNTYCDPILANSILQSPPLVHKVFTREFLLATHGEYRPLGYALFALVNRFMPEDGQMGWHVLLIGMHVVSVLFVFLTLHMLVRDARAALTAAVYAIHPVLAPLVNDINTIYFLWGLLFSAITIWLFLVYLRTDNALFLLASILSFAASAFTFKHALILPAFLMTLCLYHETHPRGAVAGLAYVALAAFIGCVLHVPVLITLGVLLVLLVVAGVATGLRADRYVALAKLLPPYLAIALLSVTISLAIELLPVHEVALKALREADMIAPSQPWFVWQRILTGSALHTISLLVAALLPLLLLKPRLFYAAGGVSLAFLLAVVIWSNTSYRDDVRYWGRMNEVAPGLPAVELNLASAYVDHGKWEQARELLLHLAHEVTVEGHAFPMTVRSKLGRTYAGLGDDKVAGFFFFDTTKAAWYYRIMKHPLMESADYEFRVGYLSAAEYAWACCLVLDPYDVRLYNNLGVVLTYKNFFRAAAKYFRHVLSLQHDNRTALYYLAFLAKAGGDDKEYETYSRRWMAVAGADAEPDFQSVHDAYRFDGDQMRGSFSPNPSDMFYHLDGYTVHYKGKAYSFWEVPLEIGKYFLRQSNHAAAAEHLSEAHKANPNSKEVVRLLAEARRKLNQAEEADRLERLLETMSNEDKRD